MHTRSPRRPSRTSSLLQHLGLGVCVFLLSATACSMQAQQLVSSTDPAAANPAAESTSLPASSLPDAPQAQATSGSPSQPDDHNDGQTKRILGIMPNFRSVSANQKLPPQTVKDKFVTATEDSFDYSSVVLPAMVSAYNYTRNSVPEFGKGGVGYSRYLWHTVLDQTDENFMVEFIYPALTHEDTRFYTLGTGGFKKRAVYALTRAVITRNDAGKETFNASEILGAATAAAISNAYYPAPERTASNSITQFGTSVGIDAFTFAFKEFWPDINHYLFHGDKKYRDR